MIRASVFAGHTTSWKRVRQTGSSPCVSAGLSSGPNVAICVRRFDSSRGSPPLPLVVSPDHRSLRAADEWGDVRQGCPRHEERCLVHGLAEGGSVLAAARREQPTYSVFPSSSRSVSELQLYGLPP